MTNEQFNEYVRKGGLVEYEILRSDPLICQLIK